MNKALIKVLDCTIRDGGLINNHQFSDGFVRAVYTALSQSHIDYMEFGYRASKELSPPEEFGAWKYCDDDKIKEVIDGIESDLKLSVMIDAHRIKEQQFLPCDSSPLDMVRVATYVRDIDKAVDMIGITHDLGYETTANVMAISKEEDSDIIEGLKKLAASPVDVVYIVDSFGALYCNQVKHLVGLAREFLPEKAVGIHCHNSMQMAFANTIEGISQGATYADGSLFGMGRGSGNCCLELLLGYLDNPKFKLEPVLNVIQEHLLPMREKYEWGYIIPFMITGLLNEHPRVASALRTSDDKDMYDKFYERMSDKEEQPE